VIVLDSSALVAILTGETRADAVRTLADADPHWLMPEHFVVDVASALRGLWLAGQLDSAGFEGACRRLESLPLEIWPIQPLLPRIVELAANATSYDAAYLALAERLDAPLLTADEKLRRIPGVRCRFLPDRS
jgi:predicted nucleic acid-binding protein